MRLVVTGASGNLGTALLRRLADEGGHEVVGVSRRQPLRVDAYAAATDWLSLDLATPGAARRLEEVSRGADAVVHLAWLIQPGRNRELLRRVNQGGTAAVVAAARAAGVGQLVHLSSIGAYAPAHGQWKDETWSTSGVPTSSYSVDKSACEALLDDVDDLPVTRVRPALVLQPDAAAEIARYFLGPLIPVGLLHPGLLRLAPLPSGFATQFVHADDVADALLRILTTGSTGAFNLAAAPVIDRQRFRDTFGGVGPALPAGLLRAAAGLTWRMHLQPTDPGWVDLAFSAPLMLTERAREELGWHPQHDAESVVREFAAALRKGRGAHGPLLHPRV